MPGTVTDLGEARRFAATGLLPRRIEITGEGTTIGVRAIDDCGRELLVTACHYEVRAESEFPAQVVIKIVPRREWFLGAKA